MTSSLHWMSRSLWTCILVYLLMTQQIHGNPFSRLASRFLRKTLSISDCTEGTYGSRGNCSAYPENSNSLPNSTSILDCVCLAGYSNTSNETCAACHPGTFKSDNSTAQCIPCEKGTFTQADASTSCVGCNAEKYSDSEGSTAEPIASCAPLVIIRVARPWPIEVTAAFAIQALFRPEWA